MINAPGCGPQAPFHKKIPALCKPAPQVVITPITQGVPANTNPDYLLLAPNSGLYVNSHGQLDINWEIVRKQLDSANDSEAGMETDCSRSITWSVTPAQVSQGDNITLNMAGLKAYEDAKIVLSYGMDKQYVWDVVANRLGRVEGAKLRITTNIKGTYKIAPIVTCAVVTPVVETFEVINGNEDVTAICDGNVTIVPTFADTTVASGTFGQLKLVLTNTHSAAVSNISLDWNKLPTGIVATSSSTPSVEFNAAKDEFRIVNFPSLPGAAQSEIIINYKATNNTFSDIIARLKLVTGSGSYSCGGNIYQAGGGTTAVTITAGLSETKELRIEEFSISGLTSGAVFAGTNLTFTVKIKNAGNVALSGISVGPVLLNNSNSAVTTNPSGASIIGTNISLAPGATHTLTAVASFDLANWGTATEFDHVININAASVYGYAGTSGAVGAQVVSSNSASVNFKLKRLLTPPAGA